MKQILEYIKGWAEEIYTATPDRIVWSFEGHLLQVSYDVENEWFVLGDTYRLSNGDTARKRIITADDEHMILYLMREY